MIRLDPTDLAASIAAAQAALVAGDPKASEWVVPAGTHALTGVNEVGADGRDLAIRGEGTTLVLDDRLSVVGRAVVVAALAIESTASGRAVDVEAVTAEIDALDVAVTASAAVTALTVKADHVALAQVGIGAGKAPTIVGIDVEARTVDASGVSVADLDGTAGVTGARFAVVSTFEATDLQVKGLQASSATGVLVLAGGRVSVLDARIENVSASGGVGAGLVVAGAAVTLRGFTAAEVEGARAFGVVAVASGHVEAVVGTVVGVRGTAGGATGMRVACLGPTADAIVRDVSVEGVGGERVRLDADPHPDWIAFADALAAAIDLGAFDGVPGWPDDGGEVVGLALQAPADEIDAGGRLDTLGGVRLEDGGVRRIGGVALQVEAGLRVAQVRRLEVWAAAHAGYLQAETLIAGEMTVHRVHHGLRIGWGAAGLYDAIVSNVTSGPPVSYDADAHADAVLAVFATGGVAPFQPLDELPYKVPGPATLPASAEEGRRPNVAQVDLRIPKASPLFASAVSLPGDPEGTEAFVGAHPPEEECGCTLDDPAPPPPQRSGRPEGPPSPVDYRARDAKALLAVMLDRARAAMPAWIDRGAADQTTMVMELVAERLDHLALQQERAVAEGTLETASLRRSVEDHARPLDYIADPGLSATVMVRFRIDVGTLTVESAGDPNPPALLSVLGRARVEVPAGTLVGNVNVEDDAVVFATEEGLAFEPTLDAMPLRDDCPAGATEAWLVDRLPALRPGRWLVLTAGPRQRGHVVRVTEVELGADATHVTWDPRRPTPVAFSARGSDGPAASVLGNVVPAHHGLPLVADAIDPNDRLFGRYLPLLTVTPDGATARDVDLPLFPISVQRRGWPLPGDTGRGTPRLRVAVEGDEWRAIDDLSLAGPDDEVFVVRPARVGGAALRFGDGVNGAALPPRPVALSLDLCVGLGRAGNVGARSLQRLIRLGPTASGQIDIAASVGGEPGADREDRLRRVVLCDNPLPAVGGRDPEDLDHVRYHAPLGVDDALTAIVPDDYVALVQALPEVAAARARVLDGGVRPLISMTVLLRDEDALDEAERLRRWAVVRRRLEAIRLIGFDVEAVPPRWAPLDLDLEVDVSERFRARIVYEGVMDALVGPGGLFDPDNTGMGGDVHLSSVYRACAGVAGVRGARVIRFRRLQLGAPERLSEGVIPIEADEVAVVRGPARPSADGLLTVRTTGGLA